MIKELIWNVRGINSQGAFDRLKQMKRNHNIAFMALMEPFCRRAKLDKFKSLLGYQFAHSNCSNKIWIFSDQLSIIQDTEQQVT